MYHAVTHGVNLVIALDAALYGVCEQVEDSLYGCEMVDVAKVDNLFRAIGFLVFEESVGKTDFLDATLGKHCL